MSFWTGPVVKEREMRSLKFGRLKNDPLLCPRAMVDDFIIICTALGLSVTTYIKKQGKSIDNCSSYQEAQA
jgi:hypothetical protein